jgi:SpoVK/Ycf46/Vps4 family AAA+-type ATPase
MRPTNIAQATEEILFRIRTLEPLIVAETEESGRVTKALIQTIANWNQENPDKAKTLYIWHHLNGLTLYDGKDNPKIYPVSGDSLKQGPAAYEHILSWVNETGDPNAPTININSVVLVPQYEQLLSDIAPHSTRNTPEGMMTEQIALCRSAFLRMVDPVISRINKKAVHAAYEATKRICVVLIGPRPTSACPRVFNGPLVNYLSTVCVPRPSKEEIEKVILNTVDKAELVSARTKGPLKEDRQILEQATNTLTGLTMFQASNALSQSLVKTKDLNIGILKESYRQIIEQHPALSLPDYPETWDSLVGAERYKRHIEASFHPDTLKFSYPRGIILVGVPGAGKSHAAKATGNKLGLPVVFANIGRVFGSKVGQSEEQLQEMFRIIDAIGHSVLFIDEIEKAYGGMNGSSADSGVSQRVLNTTLTWLNDRPNGAFIVATCNNLHQLPPEITRTGRWDATFFIDAPTRAQRLELINQGCQRFQLKKLIDEKEKEKILDKTKLWTGAELLKLLETTRRLLPLHAKETIDGAIVEAFTYIKPLVETDPGFEQSRARNSIIGVPASHQDPDQEINTDQVKKIQTGAAPIFKSDILNLGNSTRDIRLN